MASEASVPTPHPAVATFIDQVFDAMKLSAEALAVQPPSPARAGYRAVINWLSAYRPAADETLPLRGVIEAYHHLCAVEDWERARTVLFRHMIGGELKIYWQLSFWGRYDLQLQLCEPIIPHLEPSVDLIDCLWAIGDARRCRGEYAEATKVHRQALSVSQVIDNPRAISGALTHLGIVASVQGDHEQAIKWYDQALALARTERDQRREAIALGNLAIACKNLGHYSEALGHGTAALELDRLLGDDEGVSNTLGTVANVRHRLGDFEGAAALHAEALGISRRLENRQMEANDLMGLGLAQLRLALKNLGEAEQIFDGIGYAEGLESVRAALRAVGNEAAAL